MVQWRDMDGDGRLDLLTARATKPLLGKGPREARPHPCSHTRALTRHIAA